MLTRDMVNSSNAMRQLTSPRVRGERLSYRSSIFWLPWHFISKDRIEDGEKLSRHGDNGDVFGLAGGDQLVAESFEDWVVPGGNHCGHEQDIADRLSAATDEAFAAPLAGLAGPGRQADERGNLAAIERAQFRQFGDQ